MRVSSTGVVQAGRWLQGHLVQPLLSFPQREGIWRDGNMSVLCPKVSLGEHRVTSPPCMTVRPLWKLCRVTNGHS